MKRKLKLWSRLTEWWAREGILSVFLVSLVIALAAGFTSRHPFDHLWNGVVRHAFGP